MASNKKLVFVVEDNPVQQKQLQVHFEEILGDHDVKTFTTPDALMENLKERPHAVVFDHFFEGQKKPVLINWQKSKGSTKPYRSSITLPLRMPYPSDHMPGVDDHLGPGFSGRGYPAGLPK